MDLKFERGWWMPATDKHLTKIMDRADKVYKGRATYQYTKFFLSMLFIQEGRQRVAVDIGSNIGAWAYNLADFFETVHCFEPIAIHRECWKKNTAGYHNLILHSEALGDECREVTMMVPEKCTAGAFINEPLHLDKKFDVQHNIQMNYLDQYDFKNVDFIKVDVQGYELEVLKGAKKTILESKPIIIVEQKNNNISSVKFLESLGMYKVMSILGDYIMGWERLQKEDLKRVHHYLEKEIDRRRSDKNWNKELYLP